MNSESFGDDIQRHFKKMSNESLVSAYLEMLFAFIRTGYEADFKSPIKGKNDIHFCRHDGTRPYSFIVNSEHLLFYFRKHSKKPTAKLNASDLKYEDDKSTGETKVWIDNLDESRNLISILGLKAAQHSS